MRIFILIVIYFFALSNSLKADEAIGKNFYQVQLIFFTHKISNYIDHNENYANSPFVEKSNIEIKLNNCLILEDLTCVKYENDHKLSSFNDYLNLLKKDKDISILNHLEWVQDFSNNYYIKIKSGYDYSDDIFDEILNIDDISIIGSGKITRYEGSISISKKNFHEIEINMFERMKMKPPGFFSSEVLTSKNYIIKQKIKIGKMYYIDRDNFGIIVRVSKVAKS